MSFTEQLREFLFGVSVADGDPNTTTEWVKLSEWTTAQEIGVLVVVTIIMALTAWNLRRARGYLAKAILFTLRAMIICLLLYTFYQPALLEEKRARSTNTVILLADDSHSMTLPHNKGTRRDLVASFIRDHSSLWKRTEETNILESYRFSDALQQTDWRKMGNALNAGGNHTRIIESLEDLRDRYRNRDIGGIVLLSDGIDNGRAGHILGQSGALDRETMRLIRGFNAPIFTFGLDDSKVRDISVYELRYSPFAFKRNQSTIEADIQVHGFKRGLLQVELLEEGRLVRSVTRQIEPSRTKYTATFEFTPETLGHRVYGVRVKPLPNEITTENNERHAVIRVGRDKIRVLQIAGHPSWDVRFLRNHLKRKPSIQLISFFILINTGSTLGVIDSKETSLIPFPAEELFVNELRGFDLVILQDFNYGPFSTVQHLHRIRDYVTQGGALLILGGRLALGAGGYAGTELGEILPIKMSVPDFKDDALDTSTFRPKLTKTGQTHMVTRLSHETNENQRLWKALPKLEGLNKTEGLLNGGVALLRHPKLKDRTGKGMPVVAVNEPSKGRAAVVATDSIWRWKLPDVGKGGDGRNYDAFLNNLTRWLIKDPELDLVRVNPSVGVQSLGESIDVEVRILSPDYTPAIDHNFELEIKYRVPADASEKSEVVFKSGSARTDANGRWSVIQTPTKAGVYDVHVNAVVGGRQHQAKTVFVVSDERPEMREVRSNNRLLSAISSATNATHYSLEDRNKPLKFSPPRVSEVTSRKYHERWNLPIVFILGCTLFGFEWWLRRRWGFI